MNNIHSVLVYLRDSKEPGLDDKKKKRGICELLRFYVNDNEQCTNFINRSLCSIYGSYVPFPIEGDSKSFVTNLDKWNPKSNHGKARLELLDKMIAFAEEEYSVLLSELNKVRI